MPLHNAINVSKKFPYLFLITSIVAQLLVDSKKVFCEFNALNSPKPLHAIEKADSKSSAIPHIFRIS
jgi:hypothetical protein